MKHENTKKEMVANMEKKNRVNSVVRRRCHLCDGVVEMNKAHHKVNREFPLRDLIYHIECWKKVEVKEG